MKNSNKNPSAKLRTRIYVLHGWTYSIDKWSQLIGELKEREIDSAMLKVPGLTDGLDEVWDIEDYAVWLGKVLNKEKGQVILVGHSNGGRIASYYAFKNPEKVRRLILIDSAGIYHKHFSIRAKRFLFKSAAKAGKKMRRFGILEDLLYKLARSSDYKIANPVMKKTMVNLIESDKEKFFAKVKVPTVIIWGENDRITPYADAKVMKEKIEGSKLYVIKDARHSPQFTHAEEVADIISRYI